MILHGIELDDTGHPAWFRYGALRMLHCLSPFDRPKDQPKWVRQWFTPAFWAATRKLQDTYWKFDRAAGYMEECRSAVQYWVERDARGDAEGISINDPGFVAYMRAIEDLPLYLDLLLLYLRIQADALAVVVPYLYEHGGTISSRSFREQRSWFVKQHSFDPVYTQILANHTQWFEELAGKAPSGLRDVIVHRGGTYQLGWTNPSEADGFKLRAGIVSAGCYVENDVIAALKGMTHGEFLDGWCRHFTMKLSPVVSWADLGRDDLARYISCNGNERPSFWIYPRAT